MNYGKKAEKFANKHGIKLSIVGHRIGSHLEGETQVRHIFKMQLSRNRKQYTFEFGQSIAAGRKNPTMYDILACLTKYDPETFEDFCDEFGYDQDSRSAERIYKAVRREWGNVERLFGDILDKLRKIA